MTNKGKQKILVVDDEEINLRLFSELCQNLGYETVLARNGREAIEQTQKHMPDLILMDIMMPVMNGFDSTEIIKSDRKTAHIPIIMVTALQSREDRLTGIAKGANDFLTKPIDSEELALRLRNNLKIKEFHDFLSRHNIILEQQVAERTRELNEAFQKLDRAHEKIKHGYIEAIYRLTLATEYKDEETGMHIKRISYYTSELATSMGLGKEFTESIYYASPMHDIGKVGIPDSILIKPDKLTPDEWKIMMTHTTIGAKILKGSESPYLKMAEEIALNHHEKWDGSGYPNGIRGEEIPLSGRIMMIADHYDALRSKRPYKKAIDHETTVGIITKGDGRTIPEHFDPEVLDTFKNICERFREIFEEHRDDGEEFGLYVEKM